MGCYRALDGKINVVLILDRTINNVMKIWEQGNLKSLVHSEHMVNISVFDFDNGAVTMHAATFPQPAYSKTKIAGNSSLKIPYLCDKSSHSSLVGK